MRSLSSVLETFEAMEKGSAALIEELKTVPLTPETVGTLRKAYELGFIAGVEFTEKRLKLTDV